MSALRNGSRLANIIVDRTLYEMDYAMFFPAVNQLLYLGKDGLLSEITFRYIMGS